MHKVILLIVAGLVLDWGLFAASPRNITRQPPTAQQQVIDFDLSDPADLTGCTVVVYNDPARTQFISDSDTAINANARTCNRGALNGDLSSIVSFGTHVQFIAGLRGTRKSAADGRLYSMSLSALTTYYYTITAGGASIQDQFTTGNINVANNFPETPLYDKTGTNVHGLQYPFMPDIPAIVVDPVTGVPIQKIPTIGKDMGGVSAFGTTAIDVAGGGKWTNLANCGANNTLVCTGTGVGPTDYLFIPLPFFTPPACNSCRFGGWGPSYSVEDIVITPYCGSTGSQQTTRWEWSRDSGATAASGHFDVTCPVGPAVARPTISDASGNPHPWFSQWNPIAQWIKSEIIPGSGTVNTSGTAVTLVSGDKFITSIPAGSKIFINGIYYTISSFIDSSHLSLSGSAGAQTGAAYTMASTGLRISNVTGTNNLTLSAGYDAAETPSTGFGTVEADAPPCNLNPITVQFAADGITAIPATTGYLCTDQESAVYLYVPYNADGSIRLEMRPLSGLYFLYQSPLVDLKGDPPFAGSESFSGWDPSDALTFYTLPSPGTGGGPRIYKGHYDTTLNTACGRFQAFSYGAKNGFTPDNGVRNQDCVRWTNLTPVSTSPSKGPMNQIQAAYATGLNQNNVQVGAPHPMMNDIGWMTYIAFLAVIGNTGCLQVWGQVEHFAVGGCFDLSTGILKSLIDTFSTWPLIGAGSHTMNALSAPGLTWANGTGQIVHAGAGGSSLPFNFPFQAAVSQVNTAGAGSAPQWVAAAAVNGTGTVTVANFYTCPVFTDSKVLASFAAFSGTPNCLQVRITSPFCNQSPAANASGGGYSFAGGKSESQAYPCVTPGFGVSSSSPDARTWSKLWDIFPGMWLWDVTSDDKWGEALVVATNPTYNAANSVDVWLIRAAKDKSVVPALGAVFAAAGDCGEVVNNKTNHTAPWSLAVLPPFTCGALSYWWNVNDPTGVTYPDNPETVSHGVMGTGVLPNTYTHLTGSGNGYYATQANLPQGVYPPGIINAPMSPTASSSATFNGFTHTAGASQQSYPNLTAATPLAPPNDRKMFDNRALNASLGVPPETFTLCLDNGRGLTMTLQGGATQTYLLSDPTGTIATNDPHVAVLAGWAGSHYLRDYSSPATGNVFGDAQTFGKCFAYKAGECRAGSAPGTAYVSVPFAENPNGCIQTNQFTMNVPGVLVPTPVGGQTVESDPYVFDTNQVFSRRLGFGFRAPGMQYDFQHTWGMPNGGAIMGRVDWADGKWAGAYIGSIPPWPSSVSSNATGGYYPYSKTLTPGTAQAPKARFVFGYSENGSTNSSPAATLYCMERPEVCSTEGAPFAFVQSDTRQLLACQSGCKIDIPLIRGRVAFIQEQRLSSDGSTVVVSGPVQAISMP